MPATTATYDLSPPNASFFQHTALPGPAAVNLASKQHVDDGFNGFAGRFTNGNLRNAFMRLNLGEDGGTIPPARSYILDARLLLTAGGINTNTCPVTAALIAPDGKWNHVFSITTIEYVSVPQNDAHSWATTAAFATIGGVGSAWTGTDNWAFKSQVASDTVIELGQAFTCTVSQNMGFFFTTAGRTGSRPTANTYCDLYAATANDGSDDRPTGAPIATSVARAFDALPFPNAGLAGWDFTPTSPALTAGNRYVAMFRTDVGSGTPVMFLRTRSDSFYSGGSLIEYGVDGAFSEPHYPTQGQLPHLYEADGSTIRTAPYGVTVDLDMPSFTAVSGVYVVPGLATLVQQWVNDPGYVTNSVIGVQLAGRAAAATGAYRHITQAQLQLTWRPRNVYLS